MTTFDWDRVNIENLDRRRVEEELRRAEEEDRPPRLGNRIFQRGNLLSRPNGWKTCPHCGQRILAETLNDHSRRSHEIGSTNAHARKGSGAKKDKAGKKKSKKKSESIEILSTSESRWMAEKLAIRLKVADRPVRITHVQSGSGRRRSGSIRCNPDSIELASRMQLRIHDILKLDIEVSKVGSPGGPRITITLW
jgi:hypothetical protein